MLRPRRGNGRPRGTPRGNLEMRSNCTEGHVCTYCGKPIKRANRKDQPYCSRACYQAKRKAERFTCVCDYCRKEFVPADSIARQFCSAACRLAKKESYWPERFWSFVEKTDSCWLWTGAKHPKGYGIFHLRGRTPRAHVLSWILHHGPVPRGLCVLHRCDNPPCVNPDHLFLGTPQDNTDDMTRKGRHWRRRVTG